MVVDCREGETRLFIIKRAIEINRTAYVQDFKHTLLSLAQPLFKSYFATHTEKFECRILKCIIEEILTFFFLSSSSCDLYCCLSAYTFDCLISTVPCFLISYIQYWTKNSTRLGTQTWEAIYPDSESKF